jgi:hypothetical protein
MGISEMSDEEFFQRYTSPNFTTFFSSGEYFEDDKVSEIDIINLLNLKTEHLKPFTKELVRRLKGTETIDEITKAVHAYSQFQDILGITVIDGNPLINRHYCYYESLVYARESVASWLDNNALSAITLLRPFIELSIMHIYWYVRCEQDTYQPYYDWFDGKKGKTPFKNQLDFVFASLEKRIPHKSKRIADVKYRLQKLYGAISSYNHTPKVEESIVGIGKGIGTNSLEGFFFYSGMARLVFKQVLYMFILAYPMSVFPVERYKKWGFSGPLGLYFDKTNSLIVENFMGSSNIHAFQEDFSQYPEVESLLNHFNSVEDITGSELETSWNALAQSSGLQYSVANSRKRIAYYKAHTRGLGWMLNYIGAHQDPSVDIVKSEKILKRLETW